jgi:hypothetical protein
MPAPKSITTGVSAIDKNGSFLAILPSLNEFSTPFGITNTT